MSTEQTLHRLGRLGSPNGLKGFIGVYVDDPNVVLLQPGSTVFLDGGQKEVRAIRRGDKGWQVAFVGYPDRSSVERLRGAAVEVVKRRQLEHDEFWPEDLVGLRAIDKDGAPMGAVIGVVNGPGQDRLVIETDSGSYEVPFVLDLIPLVDLPGGEVVINPIDGLLNEPRSQQ